MPVPNFIKFHTIVLSQIKKQRNVLFTQLKFPLCIKIAYEWELRMSISRAPFNIFKWFQNRRMEGDDCFQINLTLKIRKILSFRSYDVTATHVSVISISIRYTVTNVSYLYIHFLLSVSSLTFKFTICLVDS